MEDHLDKMYVGMDCDDFEQFYFILRNIWAEIIIENKFASFNFVGWAAENKLSKRPIKFQKNPLSELGISVIGGDPIIKNLLVVKSDYRDPCFYEDDHMVLASSSDHLSIFTNLSKDLITRLKIDHIIQLQPGSIEDL